MTVNFHLVMVMKSFHQQVCIRYIQTLPIITNHILIFFLACFININNNSLPEPQPLLIIPGTDQFYHPQTRNGIVRLQAGEQIELFCSASFVDPFPRTQILFATCLGTNIYNVLGDIYEFNALRCTAQVTRAARRSPEQICSHNATSIDLGFRIDAQRFMKIMDICHDEVLESTHYSYYLQTPANAGFQRSVPRPSFINGPFFGGKNVDRLYTGVVQRETIGQILGETVVNKLFDNQRSFFLARGHLAARADFIYGSEQRCTFYFVNAAPQWQSFNAGNWERIEASVRNLVANRNIYTEIYTGTHGILQMADHMGINHELFLSIDENNNRQIPVPTYFYKVVIQDSGARGVVFVGLNNPHATLEEIESGKYNICTDVSSQINYINWNRANLAHGYSYACEVNEFVKVVGHLPGSVNAKALLV